MSRALRISAAAILALAVAGGAHAHVRSHKHAHAKAHAHSHSHAHTQPRTRAHVQAGVVATPALDGKELFRARCAMCHGKTGMGTGLLARRVQPAELEQRTNLSADYVFQFARHGFGNMPPITPGDVSDAELHAIAAYLAAGPGGRP